MLINTTSTTITNSNNELHINVTGDFYQSEVYSYPSSGLSLIDINCDSANICSKNRIYGKYVSDAVTYSCNGPNTDCRRSNIFCPMNKDSECNMYCSYCQNTNIYTKHSIMDINLECMNNEISCFGTSIYCDYDIPNKNDNDYFVDVIYDQTRSEWVYASEICQHHQTLLGLQSGADDGTLDNEKQYNLIHGRSFLQYFVGASLLVLCICCISILFCYFMQHQQNFQNKLERNIAKHQNNNQENVKSYSESGNIEDEVSYPTEIERADTNDDDCLNLAVSNIQSYRITPTPSCVYQE